MNENQVELPEKGSSSTRSEDDELRLVARTFSRPEHPEDFVKLDPPSFKVRQLTDDCTNLSPALEKDKYVFWLSTPTRTHSQHLQFTFIKLKEDNEQTKRKPALWNEMNNGSRDEATVLTTDFELHKVPLRFLKEVTLSTWSEDILKVFIKDPLKLIAYCEFIVHGEEAIVVRTLELLYKFFFDTLDEFLSHPFSRASWKKRRTLDTLLRLLTKMSRDRLTASPSYIRHLLQRSKDDDAKYFPQDYVNLIKKILAEIQKTQHYSPTFYVLQDNLKELSEMFTGKFESPGSHRILKTNAKRAEAVAEFEKYLAKILGQSPSAKLYLHEQLFVKTDTCSEVMFDRFCEILSETPATMCKEVADAFYILTCLEPNLARGQTEMCNSILDEILAEKGLSWKYSAMVPEQRHSDSVQHWHYSTSVALILTNSMYRKQKRISSLLICPFLRTEASDIPLTKDRTEAKKQMVSLLELGDSSVVLNFEKCMEFDQVYEDVFFECVDEVKQYPHIFHSGIVFLLFPSVLRTRRPLNFDELVLKICSCFCQSTESFLMSSTLNTIYSVIIQPMIPLLSPEQQEGLEKVLSIHKHMQELFIEFFEDNHTLDTADKNIKMNFRQLIVDDPYTFIGSFALTFITSALPSKRSVEGRADLLKAFRDVLQDVSPLRKIFLDPVVRQLLYESISDPTVAAPVLELKLLFEKTWAEIYATDIIGKPILGRFEKEDLAQEDQLGEGEQGKVFMVSMKKIPTKAVAKYFSGQNDQIFVELDALMRMQAHPHIVRIFGFIIERGDHAGILMEYCEGGSLHTMIHDFNVQFGETDAVNWMLQAASGLIFLHEHGVIHRDVKPLNMLLDYSKKKLKLADFGVIKRSKDPLKRLKDSSNEQRTRKSRQSTEPLDDVYDDESRKTHASCDFGTKGYLAPELDEDNTYTKANEDNTYTKAIDVFSLGRSIWQLIYRKLPTDKLVLETFFTGKEFETSPFFMPTNELHNLTERMLRLVANERPSIREVYDILLKIQR